MGVLRSIFDALGIPPDDPFFASSVHASRATAAAVDADLKAALERPLRLAFPDHEIVLATFIAKGARSAEVEFHQDWTYTDEREHRAVLCWLPLVAVDARNGALRVVPGSHRWSEHIRPALFPAPFDALQAPLLALSELLPLPAGTGLCYDPALLHGSPPNQTDAVRPVVALLLVPIGAPLVNFRPGEGDHLAGYLIDRSYFTTRPYASTPTGCPAYEAWTGPLDATTAGELVRAATEAEPGPPALEH